MQKRKDNKEQRRIEKLRKEKEKRMKGYRKYGHAGQMRHSTMGVRSCIYAGGGAVLLVLSIVISFVMHGKAAAFIGVFGIISLALAGFGIYAAFKGMRERDRNYITCKIGMGCNILLVIGLMMIFAGGF